MKAGLNRPEHLLGGYMDFLSRYEDTSDEILANERNATLISEVSKSIDLPSMDGMSWLLELLSRKNMTEPRNAALSRRT